MKRIARLTLILILIVGWLLLGRWVVFDLYLDRCDTGLCCEECELVEVTRIIDGDTFDSSVGRIRLYGVDTPEREERCFGEATARLAKLAGISVRVEAGPRREDGYGRLLYYTYTESGSSIDEKLVVEGFGVAWTQDGQHRGYLISKESKARRAGKGCLW